MRVAFHTLGCKVNQYETEAMREQFAARGHFIVGEDDVADVYVINTCTVTAVSDRKSRQYIRRMKKKNPQCLIAVTGCYVQINPDEVAAIEGVDLIAGTDEKENLIDYIEDHKREKEISGCEGKQEAGVERHVLAYDELTEYHGSGINTSMHSRTRAYIKIEDGCDRFCSYCVIPYARGRVRSRDAEEIISEAAGLVGKGFRELILTGINTALYDDLPGLIGRLDELTVHDEHGDEIDFRIRLSSLEPTVVDADYVKCLFGFRRLCHHLHLSLQSGSDNVLSAMKRRYNMEDYMKIVFTLRDFDPLYGISTDIIAGFPGETDDDVMDSVTAIENVRFCKTHAFNYSKRPGTPAAEMADQVAPPERKRRVSMLTQAGQDAQREFAIKNIGKRNIVLFEEKVSSAASVEMGRAESSYKRAMMAGYTDNYIRAFAPYDEKYLGVLTDVTITDTYEDGVLVTIE